MQTVLFFLISLLGASLLFMVQPMAAKSALPVLGGAPFVWNGCMLFFQVLLLGGYLYAHVLNKALPVRKQPLVHVALLALALVAFPITFEGSADIDAASQPMLWLLSMLTLSVGLPFFVLCATSPLSQRWFAAAMPTREPYVLYAASNVGSFVGLLAYPMIIEPQLAIHAQATLLFYGFGLLLVLFASVGFLRLRDARVELATAAQATNTRTPTSRIVAWVVLALVPSSLLYGMTAYITTDIASVPLFWVVPLALYLLTFVIIFGTKKVRLERWRTLHRMGAPALAFLALLPLTYPVPLLLLHLLVFFAATMMCHGRLCELKPAPHQLTGFFLWVSLGGVLGGVFNTLVAPALFTTVIEYPLMLVVSLAAAGIASQITRPALRDGRHMLLVWGIFAGLFFTLGTQMEWVRSMAHNAQSAKPMVLGLFTLTGLVLLTLIYFRQKTHTLMHMLWVAPLLVLATPLFNQLMRAQVALTDRNVFGVSRVMFDSEKNAWFFRHGTTYHGMQSADEKLRLQPTSYYGPLIDVFGALPKAMARSPVAVMGMGVGTVACYGTRNQEFDLYEIDPAVNAIARDTRYFTYLRDCPPSKAIIMGDGRIRLKQQADGRYGIIIIDAFSSDSIPMHLITQEAVAMYASKLRPGGFIAFNISNRHIDLLPVLAAIARDVGMVGVSKLSIAPADNPLQFSSHWVVMTKDAAMLAPLTRRSPMWKTLPEANAAYLWRDDYSNILRSLKH